MKIGLAHYSSPTDISGVTTWLIGFCGRLMQTGHHVVVHLHHFGEDPQQGSILPSLQGLGIETHAVGRTGSLEADTRQTLQFLNQVQPDLFLPQCLHAHYLAAAHAGRHGLPWIFTMHSDDPDYWCVAEALTPENHGGKSVCVSRFLAQQLRQKIPEATAAVIPYGISLPPERASFSNQPFRVVYCGRMVERQKCIQQVMQTLISGCRASSRIEAQLIGDGPDRPACERLVHQAGLADRIRFLGRVPPQRMPSLLQRSQAILLMSDFEGLPLALLEAMASGVVPVVRSIPSGIPELVHDGRTGLIVNNEPEEAAAALVRLAEDPDLWNRCSAASRSLVAQDYSAQQSFCRWNLLIEEHRLAGQFRDPIPPDPPRDTLPFCDPRFQVHYPAHPTVQSRRSLTHVVRRLLRAVRSG